MIETRLLMGMPITAEIIDSNAGSEDINAVYAYFQEVDNRFSTYKNDSEISQINAGTLDKEDYSQEMREIFALAEATKADTNGYFDISHEGRIDPSGLVKGWAIRNAAALLKDRGFTNFFVEAGGDIQVSGKNGKGEPWKVGIRNPFNRDENVKIVQLHTEGMATSGTYIRGQHVYNPKQPGQALTDVVSLTVIGPDIYEADRFATAAFAMGSQGIAFIESKPELAGYQIDAKGMAVFTNSFKKYIV